MLGLQQLSNLYLNSDGSLKTVSLRSFQGFSRQGEMSRYGQDLQSFILPLKHGMKFLACQVLSKTLTDLGEGRISEWHCWCLQF